MISIYYFEQPQQQKPQFKPQKKEKYIANDKLFKKQTIQESQS